MTNQVLKISFIGYGNMAKAIAKSLVNRPCYQLRAASPSLQISIDADGVATHYDNLAVLNEADVIILAVKPAIMHQVLSAIKEEIPKDCLIISIAAGLSLSWLAEQTPKHQAIVRSMPNIPTTIQKGATPLIANQFVSEKQKEVTTQLFEHTGMLTWLDNENDIDVFTALSGSGPAYIFLFLEAMSKAAEKLGLGAEVAKEFSLHTMIGTADLASRSDLAFNELRKKVTSPGGTTAAAIQVLQHQRFEQIIAEAMAAAFNRAKELNNC